MRLEQVRLRNYRSVRDEQIIDLVEGMTLVGPNNAGKTNILRGIELLFTGATNRYGYEAERDRAFSVKGKTTLRGVFAKSESSDDALLEQLDELHTIIGTTRPDETISLYVEFQPTTSRPGYKVFPNQRIPDKQAALFSRKQTALVEQLLGSFQVHYVPSAKSVADLYADLIQPLVAEQVARALEPQVGEIKSTLDEVADVLNTRLHAAGLDEISAKFDLTEGELSGLIGTTRISLADPDLTPLAAKGQGIQSAALFAAFVWISELERKNDQRPLWLVEEPESYLHPELAQAVSSLLGELQTTGQVVVTTHSLGLVPLDVDRVRGVARNSDGTRVETFGSYLEATRAIRDALGVKFSDYFALGPLNVFVEGPSDTEVLRWALDNLPEAAHPLGCIRRAEFADFGGVKQLEGFLRGAFEPLRRERPIVAVFDGDDAGVKSREALQQYFGQHGVTFQPNLDFVSVRAGFAVEGLFPDAALKSMQGAHSGWFDSWSVDASGAVEPFRIKTGKKASAMKFLQGWAEANPGDWEARFVQVLTVLDEALQQHQTRLGLPVLSTKKPATKKPATKKPAGAI